MELIVISFNGLYMRREVSSPNQTTALTKFLNFFNLKNIHIYNLWHLMSSMCEVELNICSMITKSKPVALRCQRKKVSSENKFVGIQQGAEGRANG